MLCMGLLTESSRIVQTSALCEVEDFNRSDEFGIFVTIRVVGRVKFLELTQKEPFITGVCLEVIDKIPPSLDLPNMVSVSFTIICKIGNVIQINERLFFDTARSRKALTYVWRI